MPAEENKIATGDLAKDKVQRLWLKRAPTLRIESTGDLEKLAKPWMLISDLIPQGAIVVLAGPSYSGKTFLAMEAARAVVTGADYVGHFKVPTYARGNVLFVEQDSPKYDTGNAIWAMVKEQWKRERKEEGPFDHPLDGLKFSWHPGVNLLLDLDAYAIAKTARGLFTHLSNVRDVEYTYSEDGEVIGVAPGDETAEGYLGAKLIVLDTLRALNTGDENESQAMEAVMQRLKLIRALTGATIILIHHTSSGGERLRGSTAIDGAADCIFYVKGKKGKGTVTVRKARAIQPEDFKFEIVSEENADHGTIKRVEYRGAAEEKDETEDQLEVFLRARGEVDRESLIEWANINGMSVRTLDRRLKEIGITKRTEGRKAFYRAD
jgi:hypothetical protein